MQISVNGNNHNHSGDGKLLSLLKEIGAMPDQVAVMINGAVIERESVPSAKISEGDDVEVLTLAAGG